MPAKDGRAVEGKVKRLGKLRRGVAEETDLCTRQGLDSVRVRRELDTGRGGGYHNERGEMRRGRRAKTGEGRDEEEGAKDQRISTAGIEMEEIWKNVEWA